MSVLNHEQVAERVGCGPRGASEIMRAIRGTFSVRYDIRNHGHYADAGDLRLDAALLDAWLEKMAAARSVRSVAPRQYVAYFIADGDAVKIGCSNNLSRRLSDLQKANPRPLVVLAAFNGGAAAEAYFHGRFREHLIHGEWFRVDGALKDFLSTVGIAVAA
jgi:hypothetical protein